MPKSIKKAVENILLEEFNKNKGEIKKIVTFASPGFREKTQIYDNHAQKSKKVYNYKIEEDWINRNGDDKFLLGRNKWMISGIEGLFAPHSLPNAYYKKFDEFFTGNTFEENE